MATERSNIKFPLWRKKVDGSLFEYRVTTIPNHFVDAWNLTKHYKGVSSKKDPKALTKIYFYKGQKKYSCSGYLTVAVNKRTSPAYRLWFEDDLLEIIRENYTMSYLRYLEGYVRRKNRGVEVKNSEIEAEIPFWEFLDIEFDTKNKEFHLRNSYSHPAQFPELFQFLSRLFSIIETDETRVGEKVVFSKWMPKNDFIDNFSIKNIIYYLYSSKDKELYIGETTDSKKRGFTDRPEIKNWDFARFDILPKSLAPHRVEVEKILIKAFSYFFENSQESKRLEVKKFKNKKIKKTKS